MPLFVTKTDQRLDADAAYRRSRYSGVGVGERVQVRPRLPCVSGSAGARTTLSRDVREATFAERFDFRGSGGTVNDPAPVGLNGATNQSFQITSVAVGNPEVNPEKADTAHRRCNLPAELLICAQRPCSSRWTTTA